LNNIKINDDIHAIRISIFAFEQRIIDLKSFLRNLETTQKQMERLLNTLEKNKERYFDELQ